jgi:hypothetical protein
MKLILKNKKKKLQEEESTSEILVEMPSTVFLSLTTDEELMDYIRERFKVNPMDYNAVKADKLLLYVNSNGKVISHEGRNRSYANIMKNGESATQKVVVRAERGNINDIKTLYGQFDASVRVPLDSFKKISELPVSEDVGDILGIGPEPITFETEIIPKGTVFPNGRVLDIDYKRKDGEKDARFLINQIYQKMYKVLRKTRGWGPEDYSRHNEVADAADKVVKENYVISDEKGLLHPKMSRGGYYHMEFDRPTVGTITIALK